MATSERKRFEQLVGETIREIGVLAFVFTPLDALFSETSIRPDIITAFTLGAFGLIIVAILMEARE